MLSVDKYYQVQTRNFTIKLFQFDCIAAEAILVPRVKAGGTQGVPM